MQLILISEMSRAKNLVIDALGHRAAGNILIVDSASRGSPIEPKIRGGSASGEYLKRGANITHADLLETGPVDLREVDVIHFTGGDPFRLLRGCRAAGFRPAMEARDQIRPLSIVGSSAGAMVFGDSVDHARIYCSPQGLPNTDGFGWLPGQIMPHFDKPGRYGEGIRRHVMDNPGDWTLITEEGCKVFDLQLEAGIEPFATP
ncbi:Type 1 glutamine amidotransferase-like domain-containing protein [Paracoccus litorisediminis]|uniref:Type 1 glutamine amidotransferase-like domain-containing protein n=1 Tax=Paracoccus litorisediminis TaxID=2006130 RepID=UPI003730DD45